MSLYFYFKKIVLISLLLAITTLANAENNYLSLTNDSQAVIYTSSFGTQLIQIFPPHTSGPLDDNVLYYFGKPGEFKQFIVDSKFIISMNNDMRILFRGGCEMKMYMFDMEEHGAATAIFKKPSESESIKFLSIEEPIAGDLLNTYYLPVPIDINSEKIFLAFKKLMKFFSNQDQPSGSCI